jgi:hypothetical protein
MNFMKLNPVRLLLLLLSLAAVPAFAVDRLVSVSAPAEARPGSPVRVSVLASTDAIDGEHVGFFHAEYSLDGGQTWTGICFEEKAGGMVERVANVTAGAAGTKIVVRARAAFRGGKAGDVDFKGGPILWEDTWGKWRTPPARFAITYVR